MLRLTDKNRNNIALLTSNTSPKKYLSLYDSYKGKVDLKNEDISKLLDSDWFYLTNGKRTIPYRDLEDIYTVLKYGIDLESEEFTNSNIYCYKKIIEKAKKEVLNRIYKIFMTDDYILQPLPDINLKREVIFVAGPSNSGKSTWTGKFCKRYKKMYKQNPIVLFSRVVEDNALDYLKPMRIKIDEDLLDDPIDIDKELENSCVIFDDVDTIRNKDLKKYLCDMRNDILETGRHKNITCVITAHQIMNYKETRIILNECTKVVFFPRSGSSYHIQMFLKNHGGLGVKKINEILNLPSRWVMMNKSYPQYIMYEGGCMLL